MAALAPLQFTTVGLSQGKSAIQTTETTVQINCPGIYQVTFDGTAAAAATAQLYLNGEPVPGAIADGTTLTFTTLVRANPNCCSIPDNLPARLQVINTGDAAATFTNLALTIVRVW